MLPELSARLSQAVEQKRLRDKLEGDLRIIETELQEQNSRLASLDAQLKKEKVDVERLERASLTGLFYSVLGSREQQLEVERGEMLAARLQYQQTKHQVEYLQREHQSLSRQLEELAGVEAEYETLLAQKEAILRGSDATVAGQLVDNAEQGGALAARVKELSEAIRAGKEVLSGLEPVLDALQSAKNWGTWDMLGGGLISTAVKHDRIDGARRGIHEVQARMGRFQRELADVRDRLDLKIEIGNFDTFADYFFDGLIFDWIVQSKINVSLERTVAGRETVARAVAALEGLRADSQTRQNALQAQRARIIEQA